MRIAIILSLLTLPACISAEQLRAQDEAACYSYGFQPGTVNFSQCLQQQALARDYYRPSNVGLGLGFGFGGGHW